MEAKSQSNDSGLILISWGILTLSVVVYFFALCSIFSDVFFFHVISSFAFIFSIIEFALFVGTCLMSFLLLFRVCERHFKVFKIVNYIFTVGSLFSAFTLVIYCFTIKDKSYRKTLTYIISFPDDKYTKALKLKLNLNVNKDNIHQKVNKYISTRSNIPAITILCVYIPWLILHVFMLRGILKKQNGEYKEHIDSEDAESENMEINQIETQLVNENNP